MRQNEVVMYHSPVLLQEAVEGLGIKPEGTYIDVTFGGGGHSRRILSELSSGRLFAFDRDSDAHTNEIQDDRFTLIKQNFRYLRNFLRLHKAIPFDGLLADLGVSSHQFDEPGRGFSIRFDADLDMRMDTSGGLTAKQIVNEYEESELIRILRMYGELKNAGNVAKTIVSARADEVISTTGELMTVLDRFAKGVKRNQFFARVFQALRIEVNDELKALEDLLEQAAEGLASGGRLVVISYHSLEDRLVKHFMRSGNFSGSIEKDFYGNILRPLDPVSGGVVVPSEDEIQENPRARSAKMRIAIKR
jgi:16S rRNA (cytosine1402-N4)-methyltransferase